MTIDDKFRNKTYNMILIETLQKYQPYHQAKLINMNILLVIVIIIIEQAKFTYFPLGKAFEKQIKEKQFKTKEKLEQ